MDKTLLSFAMIASVIIGYFISVSLITTSFYKSRANNYLSLSLFLLSSITFLEWQSTRSEHIIFVILGNLRLDALFAATLLTYFLIQIKHTFFDSNWHKWIYLPFLVCVLIEIPVFILDLYGSIAEFIILIIRDTASIIFNVYLIFWSRKLILKTTNVSEDKRRWLLRLNLFVLCLIVCWILTRLEIYILASFYSNDVLRIGMSVFFWWVLYYGIFRLQIVTQKEEIHEYLVSKNKLSAKTNTKINSTTTSKIITQLYKLMEEDELFKNPLLSRLELATQLDTSESYLSQIVNQELNKSIIQFVNDYRIETAKSLLQDPVFDKYSVEAIGLEAGFKSKSTFYNAFKTSLSVSPGTYRNLQRTS